MIAHRGNPHRLMAPTHADRRRSAVAHLLHRFHDVFADASRVIIVDLRSSQ